MVNIIQRILTVFWLISSLCGTVLASDASAEKFFSLGLGGCVDTKIIDGYLYASKSNGGIEIFDITDSSHLKPVQSIVIDQRETTQDVKSGAQMNQMVVVNNTLYVSSYDGLALFDISDALNPSFIKWFLMPEGTKDIIVNNSLAYILQHTTSSLRDSRLFTLDISDVQNPIELSVVDINDYVYDMTLFNNHMIISSYNGLLDMDLSNASAPSLTRTIEIDFVVKKIAASNTCFYLMNEESIIVMDVSDFENPVILDSVSADLSLFNFLGIQIQGNTIYSFSNLNSTTSIEGYLRIYDISQKILEYKGFCVTKASFINMTFNNQVAYLAGAKGVEVLDISPVTEGFKKSSFLNWPGSIISGAGITNSHIVLGGDNQGLQIVNYSDPEDVTYTAGVNLVGGVAALCAEGNTVFSTGNSNQTLSITNCSDPESPFEEFRHFVNIKYTSQILKDNNTLYLSGSIDTDQGSKNGIAVLDVSDYSSIRVLDTLIDRYYTVNHMTIRNNLLYVSYDYTKKIVIYDISDPEHIEITGEFNSITNSYDMFFVNNTGYLINSRTIEIYDFADPVTPIYLNTYTHGYGIYKASYLNGHIVIMDSLYVSLFSVSDPSELFILGKISHGIYTGFGKDILSSGDHLFLSGYYYLRAFDTSTIDQIAMEDTYSITYSNSNLVKIDNYLYTSNSWNGINIINMDDPKDPDYINVLDDFTNVTDIDIIDNLLIVADSNDDILVYSLENPERPLHRSSITETGSPNTLCSSDGTLFAGGDFGISAYEVNYTTKTLTKKDTLDLGMTVSDLFFYEHNIYATGTNGTVKQINVNNIDSMEVTNTNMFPDVNVSSVQLNHQLAVLKSVKNIVFYDISNIDSPRLLGTYKSVSGFANYYVNQVNSIQLTDSTLYLGEQNGIVFSVVDVSNINHMKVVGRYEASSKDEWHISYYSEYTSILAEDGLIFVGGGRHGVSVYQQPDTLLLPESKSLFNSTGQFKKAYHNGNISYLPYTNGIYAVDISQPSAPRIIGHFNLENVFMVTGSGDILYVLEKDNQLDLYMKTIDFRNPDSPVLADVKPGVNYYQYEGMALEGDYLYIPKGSYNTLDIYSIKNKLSPQLVATFNPTDYSKTNSENIEENDNSGNAIYVHNNIAYLNKNYPDKKLFILDVTTPENPTLINQIDSNYSPMSMVDNYAYLGSYNSLYLWDIEDPMNMIQLEQMLDDRPFEMSIYNHYLFANTGYWDFIYVFDITDPGSPSYFSNIDTSVANMTFHNGLMIASRGNTLNRYMDFYNLYIGTVNPSDPVITEFTASETVGEYPLNVTFHVEAEATEGAIIEWYYWTDDIDAEYPNFLNISNGDFTKSYNSPGVFHPMVRVVDSEGRQATASLTITVTNNSTFHLPLNQYFDQAFDCNVTSSVLNTGSEPITFTLTALDAGDNVLQSSSIQLPGQGKTRIDLSSFNGLAVDSIQLTGDNPTFCVYSELDSNSRSMAAQILPPFTSRVILPHITEETHYWDTFGFVSVIDRYYTSIEIADNFYNLTENPLRATVFDVETYYDDSMGSQSQWGTLHGTNASSEGFGWVKSLTGFEMFLKENGEGAALEYPNKGSKTLYIPHIPVDIVNFWTGLVINNLEEESIHLEFRFYNEEGHLMGTIYAKELEARAKLKGTVESLFPSLPQGASYAKITADGRMTGAEIYGTYEDGICGFYLSGNLYTHCVLPLISGDDDIWSGMALSNPNTSPAIVSLQLVSQNGLLKEEHTITIEPYNRYQTLIEDFFTLQALSTDTVRIQSNIGITAVQAIGDYGFNFMKALPAMN